MTTYIPDLADEVLVMYGPHRGGVGTITDIRFEHGEPLRPRYFVEGVLPDGEGFTRFYNADEITPARWGTWRIQFTTVADPNTPILSADITDAPIEPLEMILDGMRGVPWFVVDAAHARRVGVATAHVETVEVIVTERRDHR